MASSVKAWPILIIVLLSCCIPVTCGEDLSLETVSPDGAHTASVFERNCGATTSFVTHINLRPTGGSYSIGSSGAIYDGEVFVVRGRHEVDILWEAGEILRVRCETCKQDDVFKSAPRWKFVTITYELGPQVTPGR